MEILLGIRFTRKILSRKRLLLIIIWLVWIFYHRLCIICLILLFWALLSFMTRFEEILFPQSLQLSECLLNVIIFFIIHSLSMYILMEASEPIIIVRLDTIIRPILLSWITFLLKFLNYALNYILVELINALSLRWPKRFSCVLGSKFSYIGRLSWMSWIGDVGLGLVARGLDLVRRARDAWWPTAHTWTLQLIIIIHFGKTL